LLGCCRHSPWGSGTREPSRCRPRRRPRRPHRSPLRTFPGTGGLPAARRAEPDDHQTGDDHLDVDEDLPEPFPGCIGHVMGQIVDGPDDEDIRRARNGLQKCREAMLSGDYRIVVLDQAVVSCLCRDDTGCRCGGRTPLRCRGRARHRQGLS